MIIPVELYRSAVSSAAFMVPERNSYGRPSMGVTGEGSSAVEKGSVKTIRGLSIV
jgi:hypothetical protein